MERDVSDTRITCATVLMALFQKRRCSQTMTKSCSCCSCLCHTYEDSSKNMSELLEINDNKFFNCKCNHECQNTKLCKRCQKLNKRRQPKKKIVKLQIEHTSSFSSLGLPNKQHQASSCDKLRNTLSLCKMLHGKPCSNSICSPVQRGLAHTRKNLVISADDIFLSPGADRRNAQAPKPSSRLKSSRTNQAASCAYEWTIPYSKIEIGPLEATSPKGPVYRGRWHGDVMIYTRSHTTPEQIEEFNNEVALLGMIRHENVVLFMGACIEPPNLAVITSVRKGHTLYTHLHVRQTPFHFGSKFSIAKQLAQGMGYLHAKGITLGKLCSRNVFLESKVKIAITDYTMVDQPSIKHDYGCIPKGHLTYLSPELMRTLRKDGVYLSCAQGTSQKSDVFAYGTVLYELFMGRYPYNGVHPEIIVWMMCNRHVQQLHGADFPLIFKGVVESCWMKEANQRPEFHEILTNMRKLYIPRSLQKKLSLSDSGAINKQQQQGLAHFSQLNTSPTQNAGWKKP